MTTDSIKQNSPDCTPINLSKNNCVDGVPEHWKTTRIRFVCQLNPSKIEIQTMPLDTLVSFLPMEKISTDGQILLDEIKTIKDVIQGYTYFRNGDIVLAKITPCFENGKGAICKDLHNRIGFGTTELHVLRANQEINPRFLFYVTKSHQFRALGEAFMQGAAGQKRVTDSFIRDFRILLPTLPEQNYITNFLDTKTTLIDDLIAKKEKQIELLKEKRTAIINKAVTKGLDPNVPMKNSEIDWLGEIPKHWKYKKLRFVCTLNPSKSEVSSLPKTTEVSFLPMEKISEVGEIVLDESRAIGDVYQGFTYFCNGDVILAKITPCFENGKGAICHDLVNGIGFGTTELHVFRCGSEIIPKFLFYVSKSYPFRVMGEAFMQGAAGQKRVTDGFLRDFIVTFPPNDEQQIIVDSLDQRLEELSIATVKLQAQIEKLREYRQSLISAAVTGKIDVRETVHAS